MGKILHEFDQFFACLLKLRQELLRHVIVEIQLDERQIPSMIHSGWLYSFLGFAKNCAERHKHVVPHQEIGILKRNAKLAKPFPNRMALGSIAASGIGKNIGNVFCCEVFFLLLKRNAAADGK